MWVKVNTFTILIHCIKAKTDSHRKSLYSTLCIGVKPFIVWGFFSMAKIFSQKKDYVCRSSLLMIRKYMTIEYSL